MKRFVLSLMICLASLTMLFGQTNITVSGTVTDTSTNTVVPFFPVFIESLDAAGNLYTSFVLTDANGLYVDTLSTSANQFDSIIIGYTPCMVQALTTVAFFNVNSNIVHNISTCGNGGGGNPSCDASFQTVPLGLTQLFYSNYPPTPLPTINHSWTFGDGNSSIQSNPSHTYASAGTYNVCHIFSYQNCADTFCSSITVTSNGGGGNPLCDASFQSFALGNQVFFGSNNPPIPGITHDWIFGDGNSSNQASPTHTYASAGTYNVCHIVVGPNCTDTMCQSITVTSGGGGGGNPCSAFFFAFPDSNLSSWHFLPADTNLATYNWTFGDGNTSTQPVPMHTYANTGTYTACLVVTDGAGCVDSFCQTIHVLPPPNPCDASFTVAPLGTLVCFFPTNPNAASYSWDFGDGNTGSASHPNHQYASAGTYNVCLIIDDGNGCMDTSCQSIVVTGGGGNPWCDATFFPVPDTNFYTWTFFPLDTSYTSYAWDFGDGNNSTAIVPTHTYASAGTYNVCLIVSTNNCTDTLCTVVTAGPPPTFCDASFGSHALGQNMVDFNAFFFNSSYSWDFGDGNTGTGQNVTHTYAAAGTYNVCLIVDDGLGCQDTVCQQVSTTPIVNPGLVFGVAMTDTTPAIDFTAYLIVYDSVAGTLSAIDTMVSTNQGGFFALIAPTGDYLVKVALNSGDPDYSNYMPTYYGDEMMWNNATMVNVNMFPFIGINMISGTNLGGPGFVGGLVSQGANKNGEGDPMEGIHVLLLDMAGNAVVHAETNHEGEFEFDNLAYGTYEVIVEMWGRTHDPYMVTIDANNPSIGNLGFEVNETEVVALGATVIDPIDLGVEGLKVYPNPSTGRTQLTMNLDQVSSLELRAVNMLGQAVIHESRSQAVGNINWQLDLSDQPEGLYFVQLLVDGNALPAIRIVIKK